VLGEGAAAVVLEKAGLAQARNAPVLGEFLGSGCVTEAMGVLDLKPDGDGLARAIRIALTDAGITAADVGMVVAHGNGTPASDASEAAALRNVFGTQLPPVTAFKWAYGHLISGSGVIDLALALVALRERFVPGIATLGAVDPKFGPFPASSAPQAPRSNLALVLCRGFAAMNVALLVRARSHTAP
jgi:3-oxoacyl-[acyl-carrier-protein] synthase-1